jgi:hypothetical protein
MPVMIESSWPAGCMRLCRGRSRRRRAASGRRGRNTEVLTFDGDQVRGVEVYFGWNL